MKLQFSCRLAINMEGYTKDRSGFIKVKKESIVWNFFKRHTKLLLAKCMKCEKIIKIACSSTTPLHQHLKEHAKNISYHDQSV